LPAGRTRHSTQRGGEREHAFAVARRSTTTAPLSPLTEILRYKRQIITPNTHAGASERGGSTGTVRLAHDHHCSRERPAAVTNGSVARRHHTRVGVHSLRDGRAHKNAQLAEKPRRGHRTRLSEGQGRARPDLRYRRTVPSGCRGYPRLLLEPNCTRGPDPCAHRTPDSSAASAGCQRIERGTPRRGGEEREHAFAVARRSTTTAP